MGGGGEGGRREWEGHIGRVGEDRYGRVMIHFVDHLWVCPL